MDYFFYGKRDASWSMGVKSVPEVINVVIVGPRKLAH